LRYELPTIRAQKRADEIVTRAESIRKELSRQNLNLWGAEYFPVADILARPLVVDAPKAVIKAVGDRPFWSLHALIEELLDEVQVQSLAPHDLAKVEHIVLVAGGARKVFPISHFLVRSLKTRTAAWRHSLVTDYWTACDLLAVADGMRLEQRQTAATPAEPADEGVTAVASPA